LKQALLTIKKGIKIDQDWIVLREGNFTNIEQDAKNEIHHVVVCVSAEAFYLKKPSDRWFDSNPFTPNDKYIEQITKLHRVIDEVFGFSPIYVITKIDLVPKGYIQKYDIDTDMHQRIIGNRFFKIQNPKDNEGSWLVKYKNGIFASFAEIGFMFEQIDLDVELRKRM